MNGDSKHIPSDMQLILDPPDMAHRNLNDFIFQCSSTILKSYKCSLDVQVKDLNSVMKNVKSKF